MLTHPVLVKLAHHHSPRVWAVVVVVSFVLAMGAGLVLAVSRGVVLPQPLGTWYDRSEVFMRDTVRLTFQSRKKGSVGVSETVYMAPPGILEQDKAFIWLAEDVLVAQQVAVSQAQTKPKLTPLRLLDAGWQPEVADKK
ncbi:hypothetical protein [Rhodoferax sp.]|uniref:hypothetical protein n=1 Tax=Rhodoferax sp. TaxID=50421 RepID=UPI002628F1CD|nr:hypothetical protein [Rhodoferax sp.]MDD2810174.1 hypothetical protein [Rhodoferax sp.]MDD4944854.1 hypothetical protein [Rhodoferax sp.]